MTTNKGFENEKRFEQTFGIALNEKPNIKYSVESDTLNGISLKSFKFSVPSDLRIFEKSDDLIEKLANDHLKNTASRCYCITIYGKFYFMSPRLFKEAMIRFSRLDRDSEKNGGKIKVRCGATKKMAKWLETQGIKGL